MLNDRSLSHWLHRATPFLATLVCLALFFFLSLSSAQASFLHCRTDPIILLSNGDVITILVDVNTDPSQVQGIDYVLRVPQGVTAANVIYLGDVNFPETLTLKPNTDSEYVSQTVVRTAKSVSVNVTMSLGGASESETGTSNQKITTSLDINE